MPMLAAALAMLPAAAPSAIPSAPVPVAPAPLSALSPAGMPPVPVVVSPAAGRVVLTVYRAPGRRPGQAPDRAFPTGFAMVTETRTIRVPAGAAVLRFEGVADGIVPVSAIVSGLPGGTIETNRDARLLSPAALVDGTLGRRVTLRRTDRASGTVRELPATIVAGPADGVILKTAEGIETLRCSGLGETPLYDGVPPGLSTKPVLSVTTRSPRAATVTVTLSYLASGFDWGASYVATVAADGKTLDLFAWLTLVNAGAVPFADARVQAVAGRLQRVAVRGIVAAAAKLELRCFPLGTTTSGLAAPGNAEDIVVTAMRRVPAPMASAIPPPPPPPPPPPEDLGDLKLYRIPFTVTVAPHAQKQVALLARQAIAFETAYRIRIDPRTIDDPIPATILLRMRNVAADGLGIPLPAGTTTLYRRRGAMPLLIGMGTIGDTAQGERVGMTAGISRQIMALQAAGRNRQRRVTLTNAGPVAVPVEVAIGDAGDAPFMATAPAPIPGRIEGIQSWRITVPANGSATIVYRLPDR